MSLTLGQKCASNIITMSKMTPQKIKKATKMTIQGESTRSIGRTLDVNHGTIAKAINKPEIRAIIEREAAAIITEGLEPARKTLTRLARVGNKATGDLAETKLSLDASKHITSIAGLSGNAPGTIINQLIQINSDPETTKEIQNLKSYLQTQWTQGQTIEAKEV